MNECPYSLQLETILFLNIFRWSFCEVIRNLSLARLYLNLLNMVLHGDKTALTEDIARGNPMYQKADLQSNYWADL